MNEELLAATVLYCPICSFALLFSHNAFFHLFAIVQLMLNQHKSAVHQQAANTLAATQREL
jgi:hypothetical protein